MWERETASETKPVGHPLTKPSRAIPIPEKVAIGEVGLKHTRSMSRSPRTKGSHVGLIFPLGENRIDTGEGVAERTKSRTSSENVLGLEIRTEIYNS